jgi:hypothetical protein
MLSEMEHNSVSLKLVEPCYVEHVHIYNTRKKTVENQERPNKYVFKNMLKTTVLAQRETTTPVI